MDIILLWILGYFVIGIIFGVISVYICVTQLTNDIGHLTKAFFSDLFAWPVMIIISIILEWEFHEMLRKRERQHRKAVLHG